MADRLIRHACFVFALLCLVAASAADAQAMRDPTRPPISQASGAAGRNEAPWILQSVLISPQRRYAIINGEVIALGASIGGAQLVAVAAERVTLRTPEGLRVIHLYPDVIRLDTAETTRGAEGRLRRDADNHTRGPNIPASGSKK